jgi:hypothetical protein
MLYPSELQPLRQVYHEALWLFGDAAEERVVTGRAHEEQHGKGKPERDTRGQKIPAHQALGFGRHRRALFSGGASPGDQTLLHAPDHSPGVEQHDQAKPAADADRQMAVRSLGATVQNQHAPRRGEHDERNGDRSHPGINGKRIAAAVDGSSPSA